MTKRQRPINEGSFLRVSSSQRRGSPELAEYQQEIAGKSPSRRWRKTRALDRREQGISYREKVADPEERRRLYIKRFHEERELAKRHPELEPARQQRIRQQAQRCKELEAWKAKKKAAGEWRPRKKKKDE